MQKILGRTRVLSQFGVLHTMLYPFCNVPDLEILGRLKSGNPAFVTFWIFCSKILRLDYEGKL